ncbi:hypothetical protein QR680_014545 [Steinernema hermaphroditum]|uniref:Peptidase M13 N-terminal domain-containing protein n=1 Tax=Steinernema hermaphroditum TaxID=289476 RepID=A0AA39IAV7_9BILA|nr:hypothetical protein QR680_014545 [Steinernema hermaphroditum]
MGPPPAVLALLLPFITLSSADVPELEHSFSSTVHPCDDFHEFVCNKKEYNGELSPLIEELLNGYDHRIRDIFMNDNDPIVEEFSKINATLYNKDYTQLLTIRYILENDLIPAEWKQEYVDLFDSIRGEIFRIIKNSTWISYFGFAPLSAGEPVELARCRLDVGLPDSLPNLEQLKAILGEIHAHFFELKAQTGGQQSGHHYSNLLQRAYDQAITTNDILYRKCGPQLKAFYYTRTILAVREEPPNYVVRAPPRHMIKPRSPLAIKLRRYYNKFLFATRLFEVTMMGTALDHDKRMNCTQRSIDNDFEFSYGTRLAAAMSRREHASSAKQGRFTELQWLFVGMEAGRCNRREFQGVNIFTNDEQFVKFTRTLLMQSRDFQKAFGCKPGHKMFMKDDDICDDSINY